MYAQRIVDADDLDGEADGLSQQILQQQSGPEDMPGEVQGDVDDNVDLPESDYDAYHLDYDSPEDEPDWDDDEGHRDEFYVMRAEPVFTTRTRRRRRFRLPSNTMRSVSCSPSNWKPRPHLPNPSQTRGCTIPVYAG
ncbi:hypothetical protein DICSQDRAFT_174073 [Dichomitus squalens LYAD-421 SS1]|uniref:Uncharacterized protein n=1 Tax=Dichomitus squalens (strain LYAD-421) TaxID=732165 RepID=R7SMC9_DICSQ|nr:uncharacterized protein DICSQDRAFT_174073 [Dichomitus squalens LYAD-421 SS1]EJF57314.1 hypothetical protein DICSQDRAFT_174073 [Dichomitus squalens LYAD-421 SS1]